MAKTTLKHMLPDGTIATRTTARAYSHLVIVRKNLIAVRTSLNSIKTRDLENYAYHREVIAAGVGGHYLFSSGDRCKWPVTQDQFDKAVAAVDGCANAQAYAEKCRDKRLAQHDAEYGDAVYGPWYVAGWCGRADLAEKLRQKELGGWCVQDAIAQPINNGELPA